MVNIDTLPLNLLILSSTLYCNADVAEDPTRTKPVDPTGKNWNIQLLSSALKVVCILSFKYYFNFFRDF